MNYRNTLIDKAAALWRACHEQYSKEINEYYRLLEEKKKRNILLAPIKQSVLAEYPSISFLGSFDNEAQVRKYLKSLNDEDIRKIIVDVQILYIENYTHQTVRNWIIDAKCLIRRREFCKTHGNWALFMDPDACTSKGEHRIRSTISDPN